MHERPIHRTKNPVFEMTLSIYPVRRCGEDLQRGNPDTVSDKGEDLYALKCRTNSLLLSTVSESGKCFIEMLVTENDNYLNRDEFWCYVDCERKKVTWLYDRES